MAHESIRRAPEMLMITVPLVFILSLLVAPFVLLYSITILPIRFLFKLLGR